MPYQREFIKDQVKNLKSAWENWVGPDRETLEQYLKFAKDYIDQAIASRIQEYTAKPQKVTVEVKKWDHFKGELPEYESLWASGFDVRAQLDQELTLEAGERSLVPTGLSFSVPYGYEIQARPRSGLAIREGLTLLNAPGTIDSDYRGEVKIIVANLGTEPVTIQDGERIAQLIVCPVACASLTPVEELSSTSRGGNGFGSTGKN